MYTFQSRVRYSEIDRRGFLSLNAVVNYMQDCSTFQSEDLGLGLVYLQEHHYIWLMNSWQIVVKELPRLGEEIIIGTWAYDFKGTYGYRNFLIKDKNEKTLAMANSIWVLYDLDKNMPRRVSTEDVQGYPIEPKLEMEYAPRKIQIPEQGEKKEAFPVRNYHIDTNQHVNNGQYIQMAQEFLPKEFQAGQVRAEYRKPALYGDWIQPYLIAQPDGYLVCLNETREKSFAVIEFKESKEVL